MDEERCVIEQSVGSETNYEVYVTIPAVMFVDLVQKIRGVEWAGTAMGRYTISVHVGKAFDPDRVMDEVKKQILIRMNLSVRNQIRRLREIEDERTKESDRPESD